jgi:organic radical activating enzyme
MKTIKFVTKGSIQRDLLGADSAPDAFRKIGEKMDKDKNASIGRLRPWAYWIELVHGCNLKCGHCPARLFEKGKYEFMSEANWTAFLKIVNEISPYARVEFGLVGEPTMHPEILKFLRIGRELAPHVQFMTYTNGTQLMAGKVSYDELFEAGLNCVFVDMYAPLEKHLELANKSSARVVVQRDKKEGDPNLFEYQGDPSTRIILLADAPHEWNDRKIKRGAFSTWMNNLDWEAAAKFGLTPVTQAPARRCDIPTKFPTILSDGNYSMCCYDAMHEGSGKMGGVQDGVAGFMKYWLGEYMQDVRKRLFNKDRASHPMCSRCASVTPRADIAWWKEDILQDFWNGAEWKPVKYETPAAPGKVQEKETK